MSVEYEGITVDAEQPCVLFSPCCKLQLSEEGQLDRVLDALTRLDHRDIASSVSVYRTLLRTCTETKSLVQAKRVHAQLAEQGLESTRFLGDSVVKTLVKCGSLTDALQVFHRLSQRSVVSWSALISGYTEAGQGVEALRMYECMQQDGILPNTYTFVSLLQACSSICDLESGRFIHTEAVKHKCEFDLFVGTCLVDMYAKCGSILDAQRVFDGLLQRNVVSWTTMLAAYAQHGQPEKALQLYVRMRENGVSPNSRTFISIMQAVGACAEEESDGLVDGKPIKVKSVYQARALHSDAWEMGYVSDVVVGSTFISVYGNCGSIADAHHVFKCLPRGHVMPWNSMLAAYAHLEQAEDVLELYNLMLFESVDPDERTLVTVLQACGLMAEKVKRLAEGSTFAKDELLVKGKALHARTCWTGLVSDIFVANTIISMYAKCGSIMDARHAFDEMSQKNVVSWNAMLCACVQHGQAEGAMELYMEMHEQGLSPNDVTLVGAMQSVAIIAEKENKDGYLPCTEGVSLQMGKALHAAAHTKAWVSNVIVASAIVHMYAKCGSITDAEAVFTGLSCRDVVLWNVMLCAYAQHGQPEKTLQLYEEMLEVALSPDDRTYVCAVQACGLLAEKEGGYIDSLYSKAKYLENGVSLHAAAERRGYGSDVFVGNSLITMYGKCGSMLDARSMFDKLSHRDVVSWTAMLAVYAKQGATQKALQLYKQMQEEGISPNEITLLCILQMCSNAGCLDICREVHHSLVSDSRTLSPLAVTTFIHAYGRCASMVDAQAVFDNLLHPDVVSWTALIAGYAREGNCVASLLSYEKMQLVGTKPDGATFLSLLAACSHAGLVDKGVEYFESMTRDHGIAPAIEHYTSLVDLLGRAGHFSRVSELLSIMPTPPNLGIWLCLMGACQKYGKVVLGKQAFDHAIALQPNHGAAYTLMANIYADAGMLADANKIGELRQKAGAWNKPGESWIRHEQGAITFTAADCNCVQLKELYELAGKLISPFAENSVLLKFCS